MRTYKKEQIIYFFKTSVFIAVASFGLSVIIYLLFKDRFIFSEILLSFIKIFFNILPLAFVKQKNFLFKDGPVKATILILYYLLLLPIVSFSLHYDEENPEIKNIFHFLSFLNVLLLMASHIILLKYVVIDFLKRKRRIIPQDIGIVITTYITFAISFGLIYTILSLLSSEPAFSGINANMPSFQFYMKHIYFSFITIATVGYGDVCPLTTLGQFLVIIEIILGLILTNVILGLIIGSGILTAKDKFEK